MPTSLWTVWERVVALFPQATAYVDAETGATISREALTAGVLHSAEGAPASSAAGQIAAFGFGNSLLWLKWFLASQRLGMAALPLDPALPSSQRAEVAASLGAHWLIDEAENWQRLDGSAPGLAADHCLLKTTSGTTGQPRTLAFTSANMLADGRQIASTMEIGSGDRNLGAIPFGHSYGLGNLVMPLVAQGTCLIGSTEILPDALAEQVERHAATVLPSVPAVLRALAQSGVPASRLRSVRRVISAGAPLPVGTAVAFKERFGTPIHNFYGSSETGGICFDRTGEATLTGRSVGQPLDGVSITLDDAGRVSVRGAAVLAPGEYLLPDLGEWNDQGELVLSGRVAPLANIGGKKVSPGEIERILRTLDGVTDAWVGVGTRQGGGGDYLLAAVETARSPAEIRQALAERLPAWQVPRRLWTAQTLPRTARGKFDRRELERCSFE